MRTEPTRALVIAGGLLAVAAEAVRGHETPAGEHGWLVGAAQPLLGVDHLLAALFVVAVVAVGLTHGAKWIRLQGRTPAP